MNAHKGLANKRRRCVIGQDLQAQNTFSAASETANSLESRCVLVRPSPSSALSLFPACPLPSLLPLRPSRPSHSLLHMPYHRHTRQALQAYSRRPAAVVDKLLRHRQLLSEGERSANSLSSLSSSLSSANEAQGEDAPPSDLI